MKQLKFLMVALTLLMGISFTSCLNSDNDYAPTVGGFVKAVSYTHLRAHETGRNLVCRLLLEKKKTNTLTACSSLYVHVKDKVNKDTVWTNYIVTYVHM